MNKYILNSEIQNFISANLTEDISKILFKGTDFENVSTQEIVEQIEAKKKCQNKLATWFNTKNIYYPNKLNIEQTSSELTAAYKASSISGNSIIDLTGGFGVDCISFSKKFKQVIHCEINNKLSQIVEHNLQQLDIKNTQIIPVDGISFLRKSTENYDWIYIDPSRRNNVKGKVFLLKDCFPNVPKNLEILFEYSDNILIKASPILDLKNAISELTFVKEIHIVAVNNEVKELLFILKKNYTSKIIIKTINISKYKSQLFEFDLNITSNSNYSLPLNYLYEPNVAILKSGGFHEVSNQFKLFKLHQHSHLYTSEKQLDFPGRSFKINHIVSFDKKQLKKLIPSGKANITTRNFPITVAQIRKKTKLKDGGNQYLFFTTDYNKKHIVIVCEKIDEIGSKIISECKS